MRQTGRETITDVEFSAPSMMCDGCAEKIHEALSAVPGVRKVQTKLWRKRILVRYDSAVIEMQRIKDVLGSAGFPATEV